MPNSVDSMSYWVKCSLFPFSFPLVDASNRHSDAVHPCRPQAWSLCSTTRRGARYCGPSTASCTPPLLYSSKKSSSSMTPALTVTHLKPVPPRDRPCVLMGVRFHSSNPFYRILVGLLTPGRSWNRLLRETELFGNVLRGVLLSWWRGSEVQGAISGLLKSRSVTGGREGRNAKRKMSIRAVVPNWIYFRSQIWH